MEKTEKFSAMLGENVRYFRRKKKYSQEELAIKAGFHISYVGRVERAEVHATAEGIFRIADALGYETYLFFMNEFNRSKALRELGIAD